LYENRRGWRRKDHVELWGGRVKRIRENMREWRCSEKNMEQGALSSVIKEKKKVRHNAAATTGRDTSPSQTRCQEGTGGLTTRACAKGVP